jgi:diguanylate cyclase (GGDEF)-like protein/PAS domain S-box-containing protein
MVGLLRRVWRVRGAVWRNPVQVGIVLTAAAVLWFVAQLVRPVGPVVVGWLPGLLSVVLTTGACLATARRPGVARAVAQFWSTLALGSVLVGAGTALRTGRGFEPGVPAQIVGVPDMLAYLGALVVIGVALFRLPLGIADTGQRWRFWLDLSTVMVSTALFFWYFSVRQTMAHGDDTAKITGILAGALALVLVFAVVKVVLTGAATIHNGSLRILGLGLLSGTIGSVPEPLLPLDGPTTAQLVVPVANLFGIVAAMRQHRTADLPGVAPARRARRFSVLPYSAVAASSGLLMYTAAAGGTADRVVVAGAVVCLVGLVISRQILAFKDNSRLVTQLDAGLEAIAEREQRFRALIRNSSDFISITGPDGMLTYVSPGAQRLLGHDPAEWTGRAAADLMHPDDLQIALQRFALIQDRPGASVAYEARLLHADGSWRWVEASITNLMGDPAVGGIVGNVRDITEEHAFRQRLQHQADHDALTGLANRSLFHRHMSDTLAAGAAPDVAVLLVDLNDFKVLNDTLGHVAGDEMIVAVARRLHAAVPDGAVVARLGGDEFAVLVTQHVDGDVVAATTAILEAFAEPVDICGYRSQISASIGVAVGGSDVSAEELLRRADIAMYAAKGARDGASSRWARYSAELDQPLLDRAALESELRVAIDAGQLRVLYQPIVSVRTGGVTAVEALLRWMHPQRGPLMPAQFVPLAERSSLILDLGRWVLAEACRQGSRWYRRYGLDAPAVSVNVSARQLHDPTFAEYVAATLAATGLPAHLLTVEITETTAVHAQSVDLIRALRALGVRVSLDDFGTGQSSLSLLQSCPADEVKLDRSFTRTAVSAGRRSVAVAVIEVAAALGLDVVAEGVETAAEAEHLAALGYDRLQGFHYARPGEAGEIDPWLAPDRRAVASRQ